METTSCGRPWRPIVETCPKCGKPLAECTCDKVPELCPKCGKPKDECTCDPPKLLKVGAG